MKHIYLLAGAVLFALPAHASPAASSSGSVVDRKMIFSVAGGALVALAVVTYFKIRSMLSFAGNTPIGVIKIGELTEAADSLKLLQEYARDPMIKGILLQIDSPGGAAGTSYVLHNEILRIKKKKPVIVMIENGCYSAGYWVASAADYIIAAATAGIGSIGVIYQRTYFNAPQRYELNGIGITSGEQVDDILYAGQYKAIGAQNRPLKDSERAMLQKVIDGTYDYVCTAIAAARNLNFDDRATWADGQIFMATDALKLNLIDQVGTVSDIRPVMKQLLQKKKINLDGDLVFVQRQSIFSILGKTPLTFNGLKSPEHRYKVLTEI